jgi:hypothetical protein
MKNKKETSSFWNFQKPKNQHEKRRKQMNYDPYARNYRKPRTITLRDINISCVFDEIYDEKA